MLHDGISWICLSVGGPLRPVARARPRVLRPVRDTLPQAPETPEPAVETTPSSEAMPTPAGTAPDADAPPLLEAPGLVEAGLSEVTPNASPANEATATNEPLELDGMEGPRRGSPAPLELDGIEAPTYEEPLELDAIARPAWDDVFDFDTDGSDSVVAQAAEAEASEPAADAAMVAQNAAPPSSSAFTAYVAALVDVALAAGHTRAAALLPRLVDGNPIDGADLPEDMERRLVTADVLARKGDAIVAHESFAMIATAWRRVLSGETNDLVECGDSTLDGWSAELLRALGIGQGGAADVRRELRRRGVAAFGMLLAA